MPSRAGIEQRSGKITRAYGLVGGGGCAVMDVASATELHLPGSPEGAPPARLAAGLRQAGSIIEVKAGVRMTSTRPSI